MITSNSTLFFYEFLLPSATQLENWDSNNTENHENHPSTDVKCGPSRMWQTIDEMFLVLYRLRYKILEKDLRDLV